jgi:Sec-independent protein translocase protein TatA
MEHGIFGWIFIVVALIFIFGGSKRLEDLGKGFGGFMREFNKAKKVGDDAAETKTTPVQTIDEVKPEQKTEEPPKH